MDVSHFFSNALLKRKLCALFSGMGLFDEEILEQAFKERLGDGAYQKFKEDTGTNKSITEAVKPDTSAPIFGFDWAARSEQPATPTVEEKVMETVTLATNEEPSRAAPEQRDHRVLIPLPPRINEVAPSVYRHDAVAELEFLEKYKHVIHTGAAKDVQQNTEPIGKKVWHFLTKTVVGRFLLVAMFLVCSFLVVMLLQGIARLGTKQLFSVGVLIVIVNCVVAIFFLSRHF